MAPGRALKFTLMMALILQRTGAQPKAPAILRSQTRVVQIDVVAKDSHGRAVGDLTKEDFQITDGRKQREIQIFSLDRGDKTKGPSLPPVVRPPNVFSNRVPALAESGRVVALVLDADNTTFDDFASAREQVISLIRQATPGDRMAIYVQYRGLSIVQDYTSDRDQLLKSMQAYRPPPIRPRVALRNSQPRRRGGLSPFDDVGDELTADMNPAETRFVVRRRAEDTIATFRAISSHMAVIAGRKSIVWISGGFSSNQLIDSRESFQAATASLNNANVALYAVDARLLMYGTENNIATMRQFAEATGGKVYARRNDLDKAVLEAVADAQVSYTLGFYLGEEERDGKFHPLHVSVNRHGLELRYRKGYYATPDTGPDPGAKKQDLDAELLNPLDSTAVGIDARVDIVQEKAERMIQLRMVLDPRSLSLKTVGNVRKGKLECLYVERAAGGAVVAKIRNKTDFEVTQQMEARWESGNTVFPAKIHLQEGAARLSIFVRDAESGRTGSLTVDLASVVTTVR